MFKCNLNLLRLTTTLTLFALPLVLTRLVSFHQRRRPPPTLAPSIEALVLSTFPIAWFFGFLYYTEVPSLVSVLCTVVAATQNKHWLAGLVRDSVCPRFL
jgi:alpha-1,2-glucosyltransferase